MTTTVHAHPTQHATLTVVDPTTCPQPAFADRSRRFAPRVDSLRGKVVAVIDNQMGSAPTFAAAIAERLQRDLDVAEVIWVKKPSVSVPPLPEDWQTIIDRADAGIALFGGCGSCTSRAVRDATELEWAGIPAVAIVHELLLGAADAIRSISRMEDYPVVTVGLPAAPTSPWTDEVLEQVMEDVFDDVIGRLVVASSDR